MAEWTNVARQIVNPGEAIVFSENPVPCYKGLVKPRDDTGSFNLNGVAAGILQCLMARLSVQSV